MWTSRPCLHTDRSACLVHMLVHKISIVATIRVLIIGKMICFWRAVFIITHIVCLILHISWAHPPCNYPLAPVHPLGIDIYFLSSYISSSQLPTLDWTLLACKGLSTLYSPHKKALERIVLWPINWFVSAGSVQGSGWVLFVQMSPSSV